MRYLVGISMVVVVALAPPVLLARLIMLFGVSGPQALCVAAGLVTCGWLLLWRMR